MGTLEERTPGDDAVERIGPEDAQRARQVTQARRQEEPPRGVRERRRELASRRIPAPRAHAARERRPVERHEQRRQIGGRALQVSVQRRDHRAARRLEAGPQRGGLAAASRES